MRSFVSSSRRRRRNWRVNRKRRGSSASGRPEWPRCWEVKTTASHERAIELFQEILGLEPAIAKPGPAGAAPDGAGTGARRRQEAGRHRGRPPVNRAIHCGGRLRPRRSLAQASRAHAVGGKAAEGREDAIETGASRCGTFDGAGARTGLRAAPVLASPPLRRCSSSPATSPSDRDGDRVPFASRPRRRAASRSNRRHRQTPRRGATEQAPQHGPGTVPIRRHRLGRGLGRRCRRQLLLRTPRSLRKSTPHATPWQGRLQRAADAIARGLQIAPQNQDLRDLARTILAQARQAASDARTRATGRGRRGNGLAAVPRRAEPVTPTRAGESARINTTAPSACTTRRHSCTPTRRLPPPPPGRRRRRRRHRDHQTARVTAPPPTPPPPAPHVATGPPPRRARAPGPPASAGGGATAATGANPTTTPRSPRRRQPTANRHRRPRRHSIDRRRGSGDPRDASRIRCRLRDPERRRRAPGLSDRECRRRWREASAS